MSTTSKRIPDVSADDVFDEVAAVLVGGGIITMALFPFAVPVILLVVIPLVPIALVAAVAGAILAAPVMLFRLARRVLGRGPGHGARPYTAAKPVRQLG